MTEEEIAATEGLAPEEASGAEEEEDPEQGGTIIQDTDIVFDCPHCGHNLAIDYRGAGLQINCVNCGETVLVPIPDGMEIEDLDIEPGEILKQLFATRRNLQKAELRADDLEARLADATERRERVEARFAALQMQLDEMKQLCLQQDTVHSKLSAMIERLAAAEPVDDEADGKEDDADE
ncbi:MAG: hypothetical protein IKO72_11015 [Kiritimatiellae bacterium]|nr:hypothetical protein [Kiritimatiellia bacterium]